MIELSIALVIIGLIVGGILVGRDLIRAAEIRSTIGQYEKFNTAVNTFKLKYGGLPGDLLSTEALTFGLYCLGGSSTTCTGGVGMGDGNGIISSVASSVAIQSGGETLLFWRQLSDSSIIDGSYGSTITQSTGFANTNGMNIYFPLAKMGMGLYWMAGGDSGVNYYLLTTGNIALFADVVTTSSGGMSPNDAYSIDSKIDNGMPNTGNVQARGTATWAYYLFAALNNGAGSSNYGVNHLAGSEAAGDCTVTPASVGAADSLSPLNTYSRVAVSGNVQACGLLLKFQ